MLSLTILILTIPLSTSVSFTDPGRLALFCSIPRVELNASYILGNALPFSCIASPRPETLHHLSLECKFTVFQAYMLSSWICTWPCDLLGQEEVSRSASLCIHKFNIFASFASLFLFSYYHENIFTTIKIGAKFYRLMRSPWIGQQPDESTHVSLFSTNEPNELDKSLIIKKVMSLFCSTEVEVIC